MLCRLVVLKDDSSNPGDGKRCRSFFVYFGVEISKIHLPVLLKKIVRRLYIFKFIRFKG
jgi:hypothetical protein